MCCVRSGRFELNFTYLLFHQARYGASLAHLWSSQFFIARQFHSPSMPAPTPSLVAAFNLVAAFDERCERLESNAKRSAHALNRMHREHISRDQESLRTINADAAKLRSAIQGLNAELQPQLQRLTMAELAGSGFRSNMSAPAFVRTAPSQAMVTATTWLQACWRTRPPFCTPE